MGALQQLEYFLQDLLERPAWLLAPRHLKPIQVAGALTKELEARAIRLKDRIVIPSSYAVLVAEEDLRRLAPAVAELQSEMQAYVQRLAVERDLHLIRRPVVLIDLGTGLQPGQVVVRGSFPPTARAKQFVQPPTAGARLALLHVDGTEIRTFALSRPSLTLGRRSNSDITLADKNVSRQHARLDLRAGEYYLTDLDSRNGTRINGLEIGEPRLLERGDIIELGFQRLRFDS